MKSLKILFLFTCFFLFAESCVIKDVRSTAEPVSHVVWDRLVKKNVSETGDVNYQEFINDSLILNEYINILSNSHPNKIKWTREERLAYWLNAYNAFTVQMIIRNYPTESIKKIKKGIPFINSVWDIKFIKIENEVYDLNNIEHGIVRPKFNDPRIHFALNCASVSCPRLRNEAYVASDLDRQLSEQTRFFLSNPTKNKIGPKKAKISKLFLWYRRDFTKGERTLREFINQYSAVKIDKNTDIDYLKYDWNLNETKSVTPIKN